MKTVCYFMVFIIFLSSALSVFGLIITPSFYVTFESLGDTISFFDDFFGDSLLGLFKASGVLLSGNYTGSLYVVDDSSNDQLLISEYGLEGVKYLLSCTYRPSKTDAYGVSGFWSEIKSLAKVKSIKALYLCFDDVGNYKYSFVVCKKNKFIHLSGYFDSSYYSSYSDLGRIVFQEEERMYLLADLDLPVLEFNIYSEYKGNLTKFFSNYT